MARKATVPEIKVVVYHPKTPELQRQLARRVSSVHADAVIRRISKLNCPDWQKQALLDACIEAIKSENREATNL